MIIYEVKLELIDKTIYSSFILWLTSHIKEMLQHEGFLKSEIDNSFKKNSTITVKYFIETREDLESYIKNYSEKMRNDGIQKFKKSFKATRKIYSYNPLP